MDPPVFPKGNSVWGARVCHVRPKIATACPQARDKPDTLSTGRELSLPRDGQTGTVEVRTGTNPPESR
jgi:hypothetical protein